MIHEGIDGAIASRAHLFGRRVQRPGCVLSVWHGARLWHEGMTVRTLVAFGAALGASLR